MAFHKIQCPHCFTDYTISDEQYKSSEGILRCGTCREQFKAIIITEGDTPKFDPRDVFIEPLSEPLAASEGGDKKVSGEPELSYVSYKKSSDPDVQSNIELMSTHEFEYVEPETPPEPEIPSEIVAQYGNSDELSTSEILRNLRRKQREDSFTETVTETLELASRSLKGQLDLELPSIQYETKPKTSKQAPALRNTDQSEKLINDVDELVDKKLVGTATTGKLTAEQRVALQRQKVNAAVAKTNQNDDFFLEPRRGKRKTKRGFFGVLLSLFWVVSSALLTGGLVYQLWLKQFITLPKDQAWYQQLESKATPVIEKADLALASYGINVPQRRDLRKLELLSAKTEPHPSRPTTILLKVSLVNRAEIPQPLPWLEMSLTDSDGRLVARRNLSPKDYIYNNRTNAQIGSNELKKITVELLSFPKSATGYELKLLNK